MVEDINMKIKYLSNQLIVSVTIALLFFISSAIAAEKADIIKINSFSSNNSNDTIDVKIPKNMKRIITINENGKIMLIKGVNASANIENSEFCVVCTIELSNTYGKSCNKIRNNIKQRRKVLGDIIGKNYANLSFCEGDNKVVNKTAIKNKSPKGAKFMIAKSENSIKSYCSIVLYSGGEPIFSHPNGCLIKVVASL